MLRLMDLKMMTMPSIFCVSFVCPAKGAGIFFV